VSGRAIAYLLAIVACLLLALVAHAQNPGDPWAVIGLIASPILAAALVVVLWDAIERR
jgi:hypothetical protein